VCSQSGLRCVSECGYDVQYCVDDVGYALQPVPSGLLCYNNMLVLSSHPMCSNRTELSVSFDITILADNTSWSVVSDSEVAASVVDSVSSAGSNVPITQAMVSVSSAVGRRMAQENMRRTITIYAPPRWDSSVVTEIMNDSAGHSLLSDALQFRSYQMVSTTSSTATPTLPPVANYRTQNTNNPYTVSNTESIVIGVLVGSAICATLLCVFLRRYCIVSTHIVENEDIEEIRMKQILAENTRKNQKGDTPKLN
jgi:hypothetical protein